MIGNFLEQGAKSVGLKLLSDHIEHVWKEEIIHSIVLTLGNKMYEDI